MRCIMFLISTRDRFEGLAMRRILLDAGMLSGLPSPPGHSNLCLLFSLLCSIGACFSRGRWKKEGETGCRLRGGRPNPLSRRVCSLWTSLKDVCSLLWTSQVPKIEGILTLPEASPTDQVPGVVGG